MPTTATSAAASSWRGMASGAANQVLRLSAARAHGVAAAVALSAARGDRQPLARGDADRRALPRQPRRVSEALPRRRPAAPDAASLALRRRGLQLPASGPL